MAHPDSLVIGCDYFVVHYYDNELLVPSVTTLRYVGCVADDDGNPEWTFSEPHDPGDSLGAEAEALTAFDEDHLFQVLHLEELLERLGEVSQARPNSAPPAPPRLDTQQLLDRSSLAERVREFLQAPHSRKLQVSVRYLDKALFFEKKASGIRLQLFTHPLRAAAEDVRLVALFRGRDVAAETDYLADRGRTRILEYELPANAAQISDLAAAVLVDVWQVTARDELRFASD
jgi:hypothetical protein